MVAELQSPNAQSMAAYTNYAPLKPLLELKSGGKKPSAYLQKALQERFTHFHRKDRDVFREITNVGQLVSLFIDGKQFLCRNPYDGSWGVLPIVGNSNETRRALNVMNNLKQNLLGKWEGSNPDIIIRPARNLDQCAAAAKGADAVNNYYERQFYHHWFTQQEGLMGMTFGTYIDRYRFDDQKVSMAILQDVFEQKEATFGEGYGFCARCEYSGKPEEFHSPELGQVGGDGPLATPPKCPNCGGIEVEVEEPSKQSLATVAGQREHQIGDLVCELLPMPSCRWNLAYRPEESSYFIYRQSIPRGMITRILGNVLIPADANSGDHGLDVLRALQKQGSAVGGHALKHDTPIITPTGWKEIWELGKGDQVFSDDGRPCNVTWASGLMTGRACYEVEFADGSIITADEDHLWHTFTQNERDAFRRSTQEWRLRRSATRKKEWKGKGLRTSPTMAAHNKKKIYREIPPPMGMVRTTKEIGLSLLVGNRKQRRWNHAVLKQRPLEYPERDLPIDPYVLGAWLGDGSSSSTTMTVGTADLDNAREIFASIGFTLTDRADRCSHGLNALKHRNAARQFESDPNSLLSNLRSLGLINNKHIPAVYLQASTDQRLALLQGLMDTDGSTDPVKGMSEFTNTNFLLCDQFMELISSLGIRGYQGYRSACTMISPMNGREYVARSQRRIAFRTELPVFRLTRKLNKQKREFKEDPKWLRIVDVRPISSVPVCCISIDAPSRLYLAGSTMIPTHNSAYGNQGRNSSLDKSEEYTFDEMWLSPDDYADITLMGDEETVDGPTIPKGKLLDVFPDGLCAVGLNGMAVVLALYPEKHKNHIVSGSWFIQAQTGAGRGLADAVEIQKQFNVGNNQAMGYMSATFTPAIGYDAQLISGNKMKYIGDPHQNIPFDLTKLPEGRGLKDAIFQFQPTSIPGQFFNYFQDFLSLMFQKTTMVTDYSQGEPGITGTNATATAAEIDQSNADAINQPIFMIKADARRRGAELTIQLFRKHFPMKRAIALTGKYGEQQSIELSGADLKGDLIFEVARNSEMPKGPFTRQKNLMQFFSVLGGGEGYSMLRTSNPQLAAEIEQIFDVDLSTDNYDAVAELCRKRLDQMNAAARQGIDDPLALIDAIQPPISAVELELKEKAQWFAAWLSQDEGQRAPMPLRVAAEMLAKGQIAGAAEQATILAAGEGVAQAAMMAPAALGEAQLAQQPESTEPDPTAQMQFAQERSTQQHEAEQNALDREHELKVLGKEEAKDKSTAKFDADQKIRIEKSKPKKPAPTKAAKK